MAKHTVYTLLPTISSLIILVLVIGCQSDQFQTSAIVTSPQTGHTDSTLSYLEWHGHNLRLELDPNEWRSPSRPARYEANSNHQQNLLHVQHKHNKFQFNLVAVKAGIDRIATANEILEAQQIIGEHEILKRSTAVINGIPYLVVIERNIKRNSVAIQHIASYQGLAIRSWVWAEKELEADFEELELFAESLLGQLTLIDPESYYATADAKLLEHFESPFGYRFRSGPVPYVLQESPWNPKSTTEVVLKMPENAASLSVIPFRLPDSNIRVEAIAHAYAFALNQNFVQHGQTQQHTIQSYPYPISEYRMRPLDESTQLYRIYRVTKTEDSAILKLLIMDSDFLDSGFDRVAESFELYPQDFDRPEHESPADRKPLEARFLAGLGNYFVQRGNARRGLDYLARAIDMTPDNEEILIMYASGLSMNQRFDDLRAAMETAKVQFPENLLVDRFLGLAQYQTGDPEAAAESYRRLFDGGFIADVLIDEHFNGLLEANMAAIAVDEAKAWLNKQFHPRFALWYGISLARSGAQAEAIEHFKSLPYENLFDTSFGGTLLNLKLEQQKFQEAVTLAEKLYEDSGNVEYLLHRGVGLISLNQFVPAKEVIERAIQVNPSHPHARGLLNHVETLLGHSDPSLFSDPIEPVELSAELRTIIETHADVDTVDYGAIMSYIGAAIQFERNESYRRSEYRRVYVQSETLLTGFKEFNVTFNPLHESVFVNYLRVYDANGDLVAEGDPRSYYLSDRGADNVIDQSRTLHITIPGLTVGGSYELLFTRRSNYTRRLPSIHFCFTGQIPRNLSFLQMTTTEGEVRHHLNSDTIQLKQDEDTRVWLVENPPAIERHSHLPHYRTYMPTIWFSDAEYSDWAEPALDYIEEISSQLNDHCAAVETLSAQLQLQENASIAEKVAAVSEYIQRNFTYKALSFGMRARIPRDPETILSNRYGDCKDLTIIAVRLLRELGVEAHPSLVRTSMDFIPELPNLDQFDHMIVYIPDHEQAPLYDPADTHMGSQVSARTVGLTPVLVLNDEPFLYQPVPYDPSHGLIEVDREVEVLKNGDLRIVEHVTLHGYSAAHVRSMFMGQPGRNHPVILQGILRHGGKNPLVGDLKIDNLERRNEAMKMEYTYTLSNYWSLDEDDSLRGRVPASWEQYIFFLERFPTERVAPVYIHHPTSVDAVTRLIPPPGWTSVPSRLPGTEDRSFPLGSFSRSSDLDELGTLHLRVKAGLHQGLEPVEAYPAFEAFMDDVRQLSEPNWTFRL